MRTTLLIIFFISTNIIFGQKDSLVKLKWYEKEHPFFGWLIPDSVINSKICIKVAPLSMLNGYSGQSIRAGVEYKLKDNWSFYNELGYFLFTTQGALTGRTTKAFAKVQGRCAKEFHFANV